MLKLGISGRLDATTAQDLESAAEAGFGLFEVQFEKRVYLTSEKAVALRKLAEQLGIELSVHAPYYTTIATSKEQKVHDAVVRIGEAIRVAKFLSAGFVVVHPGFYSKGTPEDAYAVVRDSCRELTFGIGRAKLAIETADRQSQFGTLAELQRLAAENPSVTPCLDFEAMRRRNGTSDIAAALASIEEPYCHTAMASAELLEALKTWKKPCRLVVTGGKSFEDRLRSFPS